MSEVDKYLSKANKIDLECKSVVGENLRARIKEKEMIHAAHTGGPMPEFDPSIYRARKRYQKQFVLPGHSNRKKSDDDHVY